MTSFYLHSFGCKVNQYEVQALREAWTLQGWQESFDPEKTDLILINTCAVTHRAIAELRNTVRRFHRQNNKADIILTGCAAEVQTEELWKLPGLILVLKMKDKALLQDLDHELLIKLKELAEEDKKNPEALAKALKELGREPLSLPAVDEESGLEKLPLAELHKSREKNPFPPLGISDYTRSRAVLKIQDGCSHFCTYCIVPYARGKSRSRFVEESLAELGRLLEGGFGEIIISGINLRQYRNIFAQGKAPKAYYESQTGNNFWDFMELLENNFSKEWAGKARFRISSLEPSQLNDRALEVLAKSSLIAPQLHLSLQSGSNEVLKNMGRAHYQPAEILSWLEKLNLYWPVISLGADFISGFPEETKADHEATLKLMRELPLSYAHIFPYSKRPGTKAANMKGQLNNQIKKERAAELRALVQKKQEAFAKSLLGRDDLMVAVEEKPNAEGRLHGINQWYLDCEFMEALPDFGESQKEKINPGLRAKLIPAKALELRGNSLLVERGNK